MLRKLKYAIIYVVVPYQFMGKKKGHNNFSGLRKDLFLGNQIFAGFPHRRHKKTFWKSEFNRPAEIEKIRQEEFSQALKKSEIDDI